MHREDDAAEPRSGLVDGPSSVSSSVGRRIFGAMNGRDAIFPGTRCELS